jgi:cytochrome c peroxidase
MKKWSLFLVTILLASACKEKIPQPSDGKEETDKIAGTYAPQAYLFEVPEWMPPPVVPADNPMTVEGVALGRMLFYDPILSIDSTLSCAGCHNPSLAFTDGAAVSKGVLGIAGRRSAMSLVNLAFNTRGFFWDGRVNTLEEQALIPIEDHIEMADDWENVEAKLRRHSDYPQLFRAAFGIEEKTDLTRELAVKAIAQFERTLISANARYDQVIWERNGFPTDSEQRGIALFFIEDNQNIDHPGCSHCHFNPLFTDNNFRNNGLDSVADLNSFSDDGLGGFNNNIYDNGKFRVPTLRNIELTAPYMHDGRFATLEEVLDHYSQGGHGVINEDPNIRQFVLSDQEKQDLINFLKMLTDTSFVKKEAIQNPF